MPRWTRLTPALLALSLLTVSPVLAGDLEDAAVAPNAPNVPSLEEQLEGVPDQTPAPPPEERELATDPGLDILLQIRPCEPHEEEQCPTGCHCIFAANRVQCFC